MSLRITPAIMCGRLETIARSSMPKRFIARFGGKESVFQQVLACVSDPRLFERPIVVTTKDYSFAVLEQLQERGSSADTVLWPSRNQDAGPAIIFSAALAAERDHNAYVLWLSADYGVRMPNDIEIYRRALDAAIAGQVVLFGVEPTDPDRNSPYYTNIVLEPGPKSGHVRTIGGIVEKPSVQAIADDHLWYTGNFLFRASLMLKAMEQSDPGMVDAARSAVRGMTANLDFLELPRGSVKTTFDMPIEFEIAKRAPMAAVQLPSEPLQADKASSNLALTKSEPKLAKGTPTTAVGKAILQNQTQIVLLAEAALRLIDERLASLATERPNSEDAKKDRDQAIAVYRNTRKQLEALHGAVLAFSAGATEEKALVDTTHTFTKGVDDWWTKLHVRICERAFDIGLFLSSVTICSLAGSGGTVAVAVSGALVGGKNVVDALKALASTKSVKQRKQPAKK